MWWYACSTAPWMIFGPVMMSLFMLACLAIMFLFMRHHSQPAGIGGLPSASMDQSGIRLGRWRTVASMANTIPSAAFEEYRLQALDRLEQEQQEFKSFLDQLRLAKDKAEFDRFISERQSKST